MLIDSEYLINMLRMSLLFIGIVLIPCAIVIYISGQSQVFFDMVNVLIFIASGLFVGMVIILTIIIICLQPDLERKKKE